MLFKTDENLPLEVAELFRDRGLGCATVDEQRLSGSPDTELVEVCRAEGRILVTLDLGFGDISSYPPADFPGFIVLRLADQAKPSVLRVVVRILEALAQTPLKSELWVVDEQRIRIRS
jgi:predicted nuclease of predicted toxin-antitoxin system